MLSVRRYLSGYRGFERDARVFLLASILVSGALSLFWINFNLYLAALHIDVATIGIIATIGALSGAAAALPASVLSDRIGRRNVMILGLVLAALGVAGLPLVSSLPLIVVLVVVWNAGIEMALVVGSPFMTEHSRPDQRNELFALQFALINGTQVISALVGGALAASIAGSGGEASGDTYRVLFWVMLGLVASGLVATLFLRKDRGGVELAAPAATSPEPDTMASPGPVFTRRLKRLGMHVGDVNVFLKLVLPGFIIAIGAGQVLPFLNLFIVGRFGLDLSETNFVFAVTSFGTMVAIMIQPILARRYGQIASVVMVQGVSIPFLIVLGFVPFIALVVVAMAVRNALMNASNPIYNAFVMDRVQPRERATIAATMTLLWSVGWAIGGIYYAVVQATLGFERGYQLNFLTIIGLYTLATLMTWWWFGRAERTARHAAHIDTGTVRAAGQPAKPAP